MALSEAWARYRRMNPDPQALEEHAFIEGYNAGVQERPRDPLRKIERFLDRTLGRILP